MGDTSQPPRPGCASARAGAGSRLSSLGRADQGRSRLQRPRPRAAHRPRPLHPVGTRQGRPDYHPPTPHLLWLRALPPPRPRSMCTPGFTGIRAKEPWTRCDLRPRLSPRLSWPRCLVALQSFSTTLHACVTQLHALEYVTKSTCSVGGAAGVLVAALVSGPALTVLGLQTWRAPTLQANGAYVLAGGRRLFQQSSPGEPAGQRGSNHLVPGDRAACWLRRSCVTALPSPDPASGSETGETHQDQP